LGRQPLAPCLTFPRLPIRPSDGLRRRNTAEDLVDVFATVSDGAGARRVQNGRTVGTERHLDSIVSLTSGRCGDAGLHSDGLALVFVSEVNVGNILAWIEGSAAHVGADSAH